MADDALLAVGIALPELALGIVDCVIPPGEQTDPQLVLTFLGLTAYDFDEPETDIRAVLDPDERAVLTHTDLSPSQRKWSQLHESGHFALPEHNEILFRCKLEDLDYLTRRRMELEANRFASELFFQGPRFRMDAASLQPGFRAILELQKRYGASLEATARQYVQESYYPCALICYKVDPRLPVGSDIEPTITVRYTITSKAFSGFTYLLPKQEMPSDTPLREVVTGPRWESTECELRILNTYRNERRIYETEAFHNNYHMFQLVLKDVTPSQR